MRSCNTKAPAYAEPLLNVVGARGFEPMTPSASGSALPLTKRPYVAAIEQATTIVTGCPSALDPYRRLHNSPLHPAMRVDYPLRADVAQLVEHNLAKVGVAGSNPVVRSIAHPGRLVRGSSKPLGADLLH